MEEEIRDRVDRGGRNVKGREKEEGKGKTRSTEEQRRRKKKEDGETRKEDAQMEGEREEHGDLRSTWTDLG